MPKPVSRLLATSVAVALVLIWGANFSLTKLLLSELDPPAIMVARYAFAPLCSVAIMWWTFGWKWPRPSRQDWWALVGLTAVGHVLHVSMMLYAINVSTAFSSALIAACGPLFTLLIIRTLGQLRLSRAQMVGVAMAVVGVLIFLSDKFSSAPTQGIGDLLLLGATLLFSIYTVGSSSVIRRCGAVPVLAYTSMLGAVPILLLNATGAMQAPWDGLSPLLWGVLVWAVTVGSFGGWFLWGWLTSVQGVARTAPLLYLLPLVAGVISWIALGETFTVLKVAGALVALVGVAATQFGMRPAASA